MRLVAVDPAAAALGLAPGLALADARARLPDLVVHEADPHADAALLERIADACERYAPLVEVDPPDGVLVDISGAAHLFGGEAALVADVERRVAAAGLTLRSATAANPDAARALARHQRLPGADEAAAIRRLPVAALRLDPDADLALRRAGLKTVGDLAARPTAPLAARFGAEAATRLARITGAIDTRLTPRRRPPALVVERRFAEPIGQVEAALATVAALAGEAAETLTRRDRGGRRFEASFFRTDGDVRTLAVETGLPTRDVAVLMRLFRERVESLADPVDPGFGFDLVRLAVPRVEPLSPEQLRLEGGSLADGELVQLIDRLTTRLGRGRVRRFRAVDGHVPEQAAFAFPAADGPAPDWPEPEAGEPPLRPIQLFDPPQPIEVVAGVPDGPPHQFRWRRALHRIVRHEGPERIADRWWRRDPTRPAVPARDYYRVEDSAGRRFWIFRHGIAAGDRPHPGWYLHGLFA